MSLSLDLQWFPAAIYLEASRNENLWTALLATTIISIMKTVRIDQ